MARLSHIRQNWPQIVLLPLLSAIIGIIPFKQTNPAYLKKRLSEWLIDYEDSNWSSKETRAAIQSIGTNGLPLLCRYVSAEKSLVERVWPGYANPNFLIQPADALRGRGLAGFRVLKTNAAAAIPALMSVISINNYEYVMSAAVSTGPAAIPYLSNILATARYPAVRQYAAFELGNFESIDACNAWLFGLSDNDSAVRASCAESMAKFPAYLDQARQVLEQKSRYDPDANVRMRCHVALGNAP